MLPKNKITCCNSDEKSTYKSKKTGETEVDLKKSSRLSHKSNTPGYSTTIQYNKDNLVSDLKIINTSEDFIVISFTLKPNIKNYTINVIPIIKPTTSSVTPPLSQTLSSPLSTSVFRGSDTSATPPLLQTITISNSNYLESTDKIVTQKIDNLRFGTNYVIQIVAIDYFNVSTSIKLNVKTTQPPTYPTNITIQDIQNNSAVISFTPPPQEIDTYRINLFLDSNSVIPILTYDFSANIMNQYIINNGINFDTTYFVSIISINNDGISLPSTIVPFKTTQFPDPPINLTSPSQSINSIDILFQKPIQYVEYYILNINSKYINIPGNTSLPFSITELIPNTQYQIEISSYNTDGTSETTILNNIYTLPFIEQASFNLITTNSIHIDLFDASISYLNVMRTESNSIVYDFSINFLLNDKILKFLGEAESQTEPIRETHRLVGESNTKDIIDGNLKPNTLYNYTLTPYNNNHIAGSPYNVGSRYTHSIGNIRPITYNLNYDQLQINWSGYYSSISIIRNNETIPSSTPPVLQTVTLIDPSNNSPFSQNPSKNIIGYATDSNLLPNTTYNYTVTMYNGNNVPNILTTDISSITLASISNASFGNITKNSIYIQNIEGKYKKIQIKRIRNNFYNIFNITNNTVTSFNDTGLIPNTEYEYQIIPFNNNSYISPIYTVGNTISAPVFLFASFGNITKNTINLNTFIGSYNTVIIDRYKMDDYTGEKYEILLSVTDSSYNDTNIIPNHKYTYFFNPYNKNNLVGEQYLLGSIYSKAFGITLPIVHVDNDYSKLKIKWFGRFSSVSILRNNGELIIPDEYYNYILSENPQLEIEGYLTDSNLNPNTSYSYTISFLNGDEVSSIITTDISLFTLPLIIDASFGEINVNSIQIINITGFYDYVIIDRIDEIVGEVESQSEPISETFSLDIGLQPNKAYSYRLTPYNPDNVSGIPIIIGPIYTLPIITNASFTTTTYNSVSFIINELSAYYIKVNKTHIIDNIIYSNILTITPPSNTGIDLNLEPNTPYLYTLIPYNMNNKPGPNYDIGTIFTDSSGIFIDFTNITTNQLQIEWIGIYSSARIIRLIMDLKLFPIIISPTPQSNYTSILTDSNLLPNTSYTYIIHLYNGNNKLTDISSLLTGTTLSLINSTNFQSITSSTIGINITNGYYKKIFVYRSGVTEHVGIITYPDTLFIDVGLDSNTPYTYSLISYNTKDVSSIPYIVETVRTHSSGTFNPFTNISTNQLQLNWSGYYNYISIIRDIDNLQIFSKNNDPTKIYDLTTDNFVDTLLTVNTHYSYTIRLYNDYNGHGHPTILTRSSVTLPRLTITPIFDIITTNSIYIKSIIGSFSNCKITKTQDNSLITIVQNTDNSYNITGLEVNTSYQYTITPFNIIELSGNPIILGPIYTRPNLLNATYSTITNESIEFDTFSGNYERIDFYRNSLLNRVGFVNKNGINFIDTPLIPNNLYSYSLIPYNPNDLSGISFNMNLRYTYALGSINPITNITDNQLQINWTGYYSSANISRNLSSVILSQTNNPSNISTSVNGSIIDSLLSPNNTYSYTVNLINGNGISTNISTSISATTLGIINTTSYTDVTINSIKLNITGVYKYIIIDRIVENVIEYNSFNISLQTASINDTGLTPNTNYSYKVTPYNKVNLPGVPVIIGPIYTLPIIGTTSFGDIFNNSITFNVSNSYYYRIDISFNNTKIGEILYPQTSFTHTNLIADTAYTYNLTPYNISGNSGNSVNTGQRFSLPQIENAIINNNTSNSLKINISDAKYHRIDISYNNTKIGSITYPDISFNHIGLNPNSRYSYSLVPYNGDNIKGLTFLLNSDQIYTSSSGTLNSIINVSNNIKLSWSGTYYKAEVTRNDGNIIFSSVEYLNYPSSINSSLNVSGYIIDTNTIPNTNYIYTLKLFNNISVENIISNNISIYSTPIVNAVYGNIKNNSIQLIFSGSYHSINVLRSWGSSQTYSIILSNSIQNYTDNNGLLDDTSYNYTITPLTIDNTLGVPVILGVVYTLGNITSASYGTTTSNSININNIVGKYKYVSVNRTGGSQLPQSFVINSPEISGTDPNLLTADTSYNYSLIPYNNTNIQGNTFLLPVKYTLASIESFNYGTITSSSISFQVNGKYSTINIDRKNGSITTNNIIQLNSTTNIATDNSNNVGLPANTSFIYNLIPYNSASVPNNAFIIGPIYTYSSGTVNSCSNVTISRIQINWTGIYSKASVIRNNGGTITPDTSLNYYSSITPQQSVSGFVTDTNLKINTTYTYTVSLLNGDNKINTLTTTLSMTTLPIITTVTKTYDTNYINLVINTNDSSYNTVSNKRIDENNNIYIFNSSSYTINDTTNILPNTKYRYEMTPYNSLSMAGSVFLVGNTCTLPIIKNVSYSFISNTTIRFMLDASYSTIALYRNGVNISSHNTYLIDSTVLSNTEYIYYFIPFNKDGISGQSYTALNKIYTDSNVITSYDYTATTTSSVKINISGVFNYITISRSDTPSTFVTIYNTQDVNTFISNYLLPNTVYNFTVIPYNDKNIAGTSFLIGNITTLPTLTAASYGSINNNSIEINNITGSYYNLSIKRKNIITNTENTISPTGVSITQYTDTGLLPNTPYYYTLTPINNIGNIGQTYIDIRNTINTNNIITGNIYTSVTGSILPCNDILHNKLRIRWSGIYSVVTVTRNINKEIQPDLSYNYPLSSTPQTQVNGNVIDSGLIPNTLYSYTVTLKNGDGIGTIISNDISAVTLSNINSATFSSTYNSVSIDNISATNGYNYVKVNRTGGDLSDNSFNIFTTNGTDPTTLLSNREYTYNLVPYNSTNSVGQSYNIGKIYTLSNISSIVIGSKTYNSISFTVTTTDISYIMVYFGSETNRYNKGSTNTFTILKENLFSNINYNLSVVPYNNNNNIGSPYNISALTLSNISNIAFTTSPYNIGLNMTITDLSYVTVVVNNDNANIINYYRDTVKNTIINYDNLIPNRNYTFNVKPYNNDNIVGNVYSSSVYTLADLSNVLVSNYKAFQVDISFTYSDLSYVSITRFKSSETNGEGVVTKYPYNSIQLPITYTGLEPNTTYSFTIRPFNNPDIGGTIISSQQFTTSTELYNLLFYNSIYKIDISFSYISDISYVKIERKNGSNTVTNNYYMNTTSFPIIQSGLIPDASYSFVLIPYSYLNIAYNKYYFTSLSSTYSITSITNNDFSSFPIHTISDISNVTVSNIKTYSMDISFTYTDLSYINITYTENNTVISNNYSKPIQLPIELSLLQGTSYIFNITPFNHQNIPGITRTTDTYSTLDDIANILVDNITATGMDLSFNYSLDVSYVRISLRGNDAIVSSNVYINSIQLPISYTGLSENTYYYFTLIPYNYQDVPGNQKFSSSKYTLSSVSDIVLTPIDSSSILIEYQSSNFNYVNIEAIYGGNTTVVGSTTFNSPDFNIYNGLLPDMCYNFIVTPYNNADPPVAGEPISSTTAVYTLPIPSTAANVGNVTLLNITSNSIDLSFVSTDTMFVNIKLNNGTTNISDGNTSISTINGNLSYSLLSPDTSYNFIITPYTNSDTPGPTVYSETRYTLSTVSNLVLTANYANSISIDFDNSDTYSVNIQAIYGNSTVAGNITRYSPLVKPIIYLNLIPDMCYNFIVTPYNHDTPSIAGIPISSTTAVYTTPYTFVGQMTPPDPFTSNTITITGKTGIRSFKNGTYTASASSNVSSPNAYLSFDNNNSGGWHCAFKDNGGYNRQPYQADAISNYIGGTIGSTTSNYWTTIIDGTSYAGEWLQIQYPYSFILTSYLLSQSDGWSFNPKWGTRGFQTFYVAGSNNGTVWNMVNQQSLSTIPTTTAVTFSFTNNTSYSYYRIVFNKLFAGDVVHPAEWKLFGIII